MRWVPAAAFMLFLLWVIADADQGKPNYFLLLVADTAYGDKVGHVVLYGILAFLLTVASQGRRLALGPVTLYFGVVCTLLFAVLEEGSQLFFPARNFEWLDILADVIGVTLASLAYTGWRRIHNKWKSA